MMAPPEMSSYKRSLPAACRTSRYCAIFRSAVAIRM